MGDDGKADGQGGTGNVGQMLQGWKTDPFLDTSLILEAGASRRSSSKPPQPKQSDPSAGDKQVDQKKAAAKRPRAGGMNGYATPNSSRGPSPLRQERTRSSTVQQAAPAPPRPASRPSYPKPAVSVGDFVRIRGDEEDVETLLKRERRFWLEVGREASHGWLTRRRAGILAGATPLGRVTAIEYEADGRPMVCLARVLREEETLCGRRRRPRPSEADDEEEEEEVEVERAYLALHLLKKGAAAFAVAILRLPAASVLAVPVTTPPSSEDDASPTTTSRGPPRRAPLLLTSCYCPELDLFLPFTTSATALTRTSSNITAVHWQAPYDSVTALVPTAHCHHPNSRVPLFAHRTICHGCRHALDQAMMASCRGCSHSWCPSCLTEHDLPATALLQGEGGLGPCCLGTCTCVRCSFIANQQCFRRRRITGEEGSRLVDGQVAVCSSCFHRGACRSMVRCGYCGQHWAHMDCVVWEGREAGENSERDDKLAAALGRLGKRVAMRLSSQGARVMVTVEAFCPRRSLFLLRNEQDGTATWAPIRRQKQQLQLTDGQEQDAEGMPGVGGRRVLWACEACEHAIKTKMDDEDEEERSRQRTALWSNGVRWGVVEEEQGQAALVAMMDDCSTATTHATVSHCPPSSSPPLSLPASMSVDSLSSKSVSSSISSSSSSSSSLSSKAGPPTLPSAAGHATDDDSTTSRQQQPEAQPQDPPASTTTLASPASPRPSTAALPSSPSSCSIATPIKSPSNPGRYLSAGVKRRRVEDAAVARMVGQLLRNLPKRPVMFALPPAVVADASGVEQMQHHEDEEELDSDDDHEPLSVLLAPVCLDLCSFHRGPRLLADNLPCSGLLDYDAGALELSEHEVGTDQHGKKAPALPSTTASSSAAKTSQAPSGPCSSSSPPSPSCSCMTAEANGCARANPFQAKVRTRLKGGKVNRVQDGGGPSQGAGGKTGSKHGPHANPDKEIIKREREQRLGQRREKKYYEGFDHLRVDDFKGRQKAVRFGKSKIHRWGVFAMEPIRKDDMLLEYRGEVIGNAVAEKREKLYDKLSIGSDYMFRIDENTVIDATRRGSLARYVNHSCEPNCYTAIIPSGGRQKIFIYAKRAIAVGEELVYDYKFAQEEVKIPCHCGAKRCRKFMN